MKKEELKEKLASSFYELPRQAREHMSAPPTELWRGRADGWMEGVSFVLEALGFSEEEVGELLFFTECDMLNPKMEAYYTRPKGSGE